MNSHAVVQRAKLFKAFKPLLRRRWPSDELMQKMRAVGVDADMPIPGSACRHTIAILYERIAWVRHRCAAEIERHTGYVGCYFDNIRTQQMFNRNYFLA